MKNKTKVIMFYPRLDGQKLDRALKAKNLTRQQLADQIGVSRRSVQSWIDGSVPRGGRLAKVCEILKLDEKDLVIQKYKVIIYK